MSIFSAIPEETMKIQFASIALLAVLSTPLAAQEHAHDEADLGQVKFPVACKPAAQEHMHRAVAMLHSFWFTEGRKEFEAVAQADPACGIAFWGVALTHFGNPMAGGSTGPAQAAGWEAAQKAVQMGGQSDRDRAYIDAAVALFKDNATVDNRTRMKAYEAAFAQIVQRFPADTEAQIFHGIFMVATAPATDLTFAQQQKAANILIPLYRAHPRHPGLAHYIIHAFDSPPLAGNALEAARQYAGIAPAAPHALHMPSHTFTRLGYWDESIASNRKSADLEPVGSKAHAADYMVYAYLQQGRDASALAVIQEVGGTQYAPGGTLASYNGLAMVARYALERDDWAAAAALTVPTAPPSVEAVTRFARGLGAARSGNVVLAKEEVSAIAKLVVALTAAKDAAWTPVVDAQGMAVASWIAHAEGRHADALQLARAAADREEQVEKHPVTPGPLIPARELLGDILMVHQQPAEALVAYEATLKREPNRARTITGAARAAKAAGKPEVARKYYAALVSQMDPQSTRPELKEAKAP
jgi:tetratricopeptide (TPR) repeat protein